MTADGNPIILRESLDTINRALTNRDNVNTMAGRLKIVRRSLMSVNRNPLILHKPLITIS